MKAFINTSCISFLVFFSYCHDLKSKENSKSITIHFQPSFINNATLTLSCDTDSAVFKIDTNRLNIFKIIHPTFSISKEKMETATSIDSLWEPTFARSLKNENENIIFLDGMGIFIEYVFENKTDTIFLSNSYPKKTQEYFHQQIKYLENVTYNFEQKEYLKNLLEYF